MVCGKSLMKLENKDGPNINPCGTPAEGSPGEERHSSRHVVMELF